MPWPQPRQRKNAPLEILDELDEADEEHAEISLPAASGGANLVDGGPTRLLSAAQAW